MAQQTAVEWLKQQLKSTYMIEGKLPLAYTLDLVEQAKQMEKEQIMDAYKYGHSNGIDKTFCMDDPKIKSSEQYYNETYGSETKEI